MCGPASIQTKQETLRKRKAPRLQTVLKSRPIPDATAGDLTYLDITHEPTSHWPRKPGYPSPSEILSPPESIHLSGGSYSFFSLVLACFFTRQQTSFCTHNKNKVQQTKGNQNKISSTKRTATRSKQTPNQKNGGKNKRIRNTQRHVWNSPVHLALSNTKDQPTNPSSRPPALFTRLDPEGKEKMWEGAPMISWCACCIVYRVFFPKDVGFKRSSIIFCGGFCFINIT